MMNLFQLNLLLAVAWCALFGAFNLQHLLGGFVVAFAALSVIGPMYGQTRYFRRTLSITRLAVYFLWELIISSFQVAADVLTPMQNSRPAILAIPLDLESPTQIAILANLISLTPGSLSLDVSRNNKTLYVHGMFVDDPEESRRKLKSGFERLVREAVQ